MFGCLVHIFLRCLSCLTSFLKFVPGFCKFCLHIIPSGCIIGFNKALCLPNGCFQSFCTAYCMSHMNIGLCHVHRNHSIGITQCTYGHGPVSTSIVSFRKCTSLRFCKAKLDTHGFMHPVICGKFCSIYGKRCTCGIIFPIVFPDNGLHICTEIAVVSGQIHTDKIAVGTAVFYFYAKRADIRCL